MTQHQAPVPPLSTRLMEAERRRGEEQRRTGQEDTLIIEGFTTAGERSPEEVTSGSGCECEKNEQFENKHGVTEDLFAMIYIYICILIIT